MALSKFDSYFRVVHRIPGRIRILIPVLKKLPVIWRIYVKPATELIRIRKGINSAEIQPITGSLLIEYNPEILDEAGILRWLETLVAGVLKLQTPSKPLNEANIRLRMAQLRDRLSREDVLPDLNQGSSR